MAKTKSKEAAFGAEEYERQFKAAMLRNPRIVAGLALQERGRRLVKLEIMRAAWVASLLHVKDPAVLGAIKRDFCRLSGLTASDFEGGL